MDVVTNLSSEQILLFGTLFLTVVLGVLGLAALMPSSSVKARLAGGGGGGEQRSSLRFDQHGKLARLLRPLEDKVTPQDEEETSNLRSRLVQAGFHHPKAVAQYYALRVVLAGLLPPLFWAGQLLLAPSISPQAFMAGVFAAAALGYFLPAMVVSQRVSERQTACRYGFPDALDLLLVCVEAGLGLDAAIGRVGQEIGNAHPLLGEHFRLMALELRAGKGREEALKHFAARIGIEEVRSLATLLVQSEKLGASISDTLRALSDDMRAKRMMKAEEKAQQLGVKLTIPLILFIMPALMLVIASPAVLSVVEALRGVTANAGN